MPRIERPARFTTAATLASLLGTLALTGCGMEVGGTAASVAATQAAQASQAQAQAARIVDGFKQAQDAGMARAASAAE
ncbi:hypothetical protein [Ideonella sp. A 288]|uniref:hypothetical protein n=1 Tax=Ideonella sp. A 288 TaxID=1962181 RepID=UPI0011853E27|nr:hypothetical protein [Ideonella sp. A 288]